MTTKYYIWELEELYTLYLQSTLQEMQLL